MTIYVPVAIGIRFGISITTAGEPGTRYPEPGTRYPAPGTQHPEPGTRNPAPLTIKLTLAPNTQCQSSIPILSRLIFYTATC